MLTIGEKIYFSTHERDELRALTGKEVASIYTLQQLKAFIEESLLTLPPTTPANTFKRSQIMQFLPGAKPEEFPFSFP